MLTGSAGSGAARPCAVGFGCAIVGVPVMPQSRNGFLLFQNGMAHAAVLACGQAGVGAGGSLGGIKNLGVALGAEVFGFGVVTYCAGVSFYAGFGAGGLFCDSASVPAVRSKGGFISLFRLITKRTLVQIIALLGAGGCNSFCFLEIVFGVLYRYGLCNGLPQYSGSQAIRTIGVGGHPAICNADPGFCFGDNPVTDGLNRFSRTVRPISTEHEGGADSGGKRSTFADFQLDSGQSRWIDNGGGSGAGTDFHRGLLFRVQGSCNSAIFAAGRKFLNAIIQAVIFYTRNGNFGKRCVKHAPAMTLAGIRLIVFTPLGGCLCHGAFCICSGVYGNTFTRGTIRSILEFF